MLSAATTECFESKPCALDTIVIPRLREEVPFEENLMRLVQLIRSHAEAKSSLVGLMELSRSTQLSFDPKNFYWLKPTIDTILRTRPKALFKMKYGSLDQCLDRFVTSLLRHAKTCSYEAQRELLALRKDILEGDELEFSRWLIGTIDAAFGRYYPRC